ncbi:hypothetical protein GO755_15470 [Spirosoma sp. HMF4905]|uniref:Secretion system C-terminal sorting domain-containing protein n=1 Tax=Spirosoma arboris TaxID=2682092 RepID=A0A7K1SCA0_9BACT|nr:hypothetical protein [Spirosoma arboris]MVM31444.1 hypothetical protein [Spirosoma arboris]
MKTTRQFMNVLLLSILMTAPIINAQATGTAPSDSTTKPNSFEVGLYMGNDWTVNIMLAIYQPKQVVVTLRDANNAILYRDYLKKASKSHHLKFKFNESETGQYQFEISDGRQTIVRKVEVVDMPAIQSQRYIVYGPQIGQ